MLFILLLRTCTLCRDKKRTYLHIVHFGELGQFSNVQYSHNLGKCVFVDNIDKYLYLLTTLSNICIHWQIFANIEERQKRCPTISALLQSPPPLVRWTPARTSWRLLKMLNWSYWNCWNYWHCWNYRGKKRRQGLFDKVEQNRWKTCSSVFTTKRV